MDNKHIDADRLKAEIIRLRKERPFHDDASFLAYLHGLSKIEDFIDPHQQEQPCDIAIDLDAIFSNMKRNEAIKQLEYLNKVYGKQPCDTCTNDKGCVTCKDGELWEGKEQPCEELEKAAEEYKTKKEKERIPDNSGEFRFFDSDIRNAFKAGTEWQEEQFEKNQLAACGNMIQEDYDRLRVLIVETLQKEKRTPTLDDAIKYGMRWQKEQMLKEAVDGFIFQSEDYYPKQLIAYYNGELETGDNVKIIIVPNKEG